MKCLQPTLLVASLLLGACGGGSDSPAPVDSPPASLAITAANAPTAAKVAYESASSSGELSDVGSSMGLGAGMKGTQQKASGTATVEGFFINVLAKIPFGPDEFPCAQSGTVTISGDIADPFTLTPGDRFRVVSAACDDGAGEVVDGTLEFTVTEFSGDLSLQAYRVGMDAILDNLQVSTADDTVSSNGDASVVLDTTNTPFVVASTAGNSITTDTNSSSETLTNFSSAQTVDLGVTTAPYTMEADGTVDSTRLAGVVRYATPVRFEGNGADFPHTGELLVTGENSSARLIAIDATNVVIEIDADLDGTVDSTIETTWLDLTS